MPVLSKLRPLKSTSESPIQANATVRSHTRSDKGINSSLNTTTAYYRINRRDISFFRFIFEAYDGIAVVSTVDSKQGIISVTTAPGCQNETETIIQGLKNEIMIEKVDFLSPEGYELAHEE